LKKRFGIVIRERRYNEICQEAKKTKPIFISEEDRRSIVSVRVGGHKLYAVFDVDFRQLVTCIPRHMHWKRFLKSDQYKQEVPNKEVDESYRMKLKRLGINSKERWC